MIFALIVAAIIFVAVVIVAFIVTLTLVMTFGYSLAVAYRFAFHIFYLAAYAPALPLALHPLNRTAYTLPPALHLFHRTAYALALPPALGALNLAAFALDAAYGLFYTAALTTQLFDLLSFRSQDQDMTAGEKRFSFTTARAYFYHPVKLRLPPLQGREFLS